MEKPGPQCPQCPLHAAEGPVWGHGSPNSKYVIISPHELKGGELNILSRGLWQAGIRLEDTFLTAAVKCQHPGYFIPPEAVRCCNSLLQQELHALPNARAILTLGEVPFRAFTGKDLQAGYARPKLGKPANSKVWVRGCPWKFPTQDRYIVPAMHPAYLMQTGFRESPQFDSDIRKFKTFADNKEIKYVESWDYKPTDTDVRDYVTECLRAGQFGLDIETETSKLDTEDEILPADSDDIQVIGLSARIGHAIGVSPKQFSLLEPLFDVAHRTGEFANRRPVLYAHNWGFDGAYLSKRYTLDGVRPFDTMIGLHRTYSDARPLDLSMALSLFTELPFHKNLAKVQPELYNARDTYGALWAGVNMEHMLRLGFKASAMEAFEQGMACIPIAEQVRSVGMKCDVPFAERIEYTCMLSLREYEKFWEDLLPLVSWSSPKQLVEYFAQVCKLPVQLRQRGKGKAKTPSSDDEAMAIYRDKHGNQLAGLVLHMRQLKHAADFTKIYLKDGRAHPRMKIHGQKAFRIQFMNPDMQNIPETIMDTHPRAIVTADGPDDVLIGFDFNAIELWIYAYATQCRGLLQMKEEGLYPYGIFYEKLFQRPFFESGKPYTKKYKLPTVSADDLLITKSVPLGLIYGRGASSIEEQLVVIMRKADPQCVEATIRQAAKKQAKSIFQNFHAAYPEVGVLHRQIMEFAERHGYLQNYFGYVRRFPNVQVLRSEALSFPGQTNAVGVLCQNALIPLHYEILPRYGGRLLLTVHDQILVNVPRRHARACFYEIDATMSQPIPQMNGFRIPAVGGIGNNWDEVKANEGHPLETYIANYA